MESQKRLADLYIHLLLEVKGQWMLEQSNTTSAIRLQQYATAIRFQSLCMHSGEYSTLAVCMYIMYSTLAVCTRSVL